MSVRKNLRTSRLTIADNTVGIGTLVLSFETDRSFLALKVPATEAAVNVCVGLDTFDEAQSWPVAAGDELSFTDVCPIGKIFARSTTGVASELVVIV